MTTTRDRPSSRLQSKHSQYGVYGRGARFALVLDLVDAERTRCTPRFAFRFSKADTGPPDWRRPRWPPDTQGRSPQRD